MKQPKSKKQYKFTSTHLNFLREKSAVTGEPVFSLGWSCEGFGFGEIIFLFTTDGPVQIDSETMSKEFIKSALNHLVDKGVIK